MFRPLLLLILLTLDDQCVNGQIDKMKVNEMKTKIEKLEVEASGMENKNLDLARQASVLKDKNDQAKYRIDTLEKDLAVAKAARDDLKNKAEQQKQGYESKMAKLELVKDTQILKLVHDLKDAEIQIRGLETRINKQRNGGGVQSQREKTLEAQKNALEQYKHNADRDIKVLTAYKEVAGKQIQSLRENISKLEKISKKIPDNGDSQTQREKTLEAQVKDLQKYKEDTDSQMQVLRKDKVELEGKLEKERANCDANMEADLEVDDF